MPRGAGASTGRDREALLATTSTAFALVIFLGGDLFSGTTYRARRASLPRRVPLSGPGYLLSPSSLHHSMSAREMLIVDGRRGRWSWSNHPADSISLLSTITSPPA